MQFETIYFVEKRSKKDVFAGDVLEWTISLSDERTQHYKKDLEESAKDENVYYIVRSMVITN